MEKKYRFHLAYCVHRLRRQGESSVGYFSALKLLIFKEKEKKKRNTENYYERHPFKYLLWHLLFFFPFLISRPTDQEVKKCNVKWSLKNNNKRSYIFNLHINNKILNKFEINIEIILLKL